MGLFKDISEFNRNLRIIDSLVEEAATELSGRTKMGVYEDMANDAGYPFDTEENANCASWLESQDRQQMEQFHEEQQYQEERQEKYAEMVLLADRLRELMGFLGSDKCPVCRKPWSVEEIVAKVEKKLKDEL